MGFRWLVRSVVPAFVIVTVVLAAVPASAAASPDYYQANSVTPAWHLAFDAPVQWQRVTSMGRLVVGTADALYGVDAEQGKVLWKHPNLRSMAPDRFEELSGTPLVVAATPGAEGRVVVLNSMNGTILFDSMEAGVVRVLSKTLLPRNGSLVVYGMEREKLEATAYAYDLATGKLKWKNGDLLGAGGGKVMKALTAIAFAVLDTDEDDVDPPLELDDNSFLLNSGYGIYHIDSNSGEVLWKASTQDIGETIQFYYSDHDPDRVYVGGQLASSGSTPASMLTSYYMAFKLADGSRAWEKRVKVKGHVGEPIFLPAGVILNSGGKDKGTVKYVEYASGLSTWGKNGKGLKTRGGIVDYEQSEYGMVVTTGFNSAWTDRGTEFYLNILDTNAGTMKFSDPVKVKGRMLSTEIGPKGILYRTTSEVNILDPGSGQLRFKKSIRSENGVVSTTVGNTIYAFTEDDGALWSVDRETGAAVQLTDEKIKLQGRERPRRLEVNGDDITLISSQNMVAFGTDGTVRFQKYYPAPRYPGIVRALMIAEAVRTGMAAVSSGMTGAGFAKAASEQDEDSMGYLIAAGMADGYAQMGDAYAGLSGQYMSEARRRFKASATSRDFVFMMVQLEKGNYGLAQIEKSSGEVRGMIRLGKDKEPSYQVDNVDSRIYYRLSPREIIGYRF